MIGATSVGVEDGASPVIVTSISVVVVVVESAVTKLVTSPTEGAEVTTAEEDASAVDEES